ncbi:MULTISPECIES: helix-turn-helix domain-containing protein [Desulfofundulus]|jgi:transcriptional regulator with XRE-family HTH domain|uniref:Helix-turn-helix domain protein n=1 Tax=Desulfofundulus kuznetsovii (strain DSM 6115 / VKM B-1805 / 17) TaxID=760568 RepID=A0AAU8P7R3_DESK7|nr:MULTISPECIES: helix-turn-helix transcriptional regulator [Desulfofundulus]AEG13697.1 helix-turn-helix domain protein [Desulfofundulus kuznetsovii DSM 6115]MBE3585951.1 helix-turn-helix transcriptional regulator [Thermoanaerobacter sp.]MCS5696857.1 helix-turn-helix domain-containing protein [Desulfofundulus thermocisternus]NHM26679.1 helix-turn-helix transcriptional regulator [Desulfofundulus sp. TPOSR]
MSLGQKIRDFRKERGITLTELASQLKISPSYLSAVEREIRKPSIPMLKRISEALNVSVSYLVGDTDDTVTGEKLRFMRESRGLSIQDLAEISELPASMLEKFENGQATPDLEDLKKLSEALNVTLRYFLDQTDRPDSLGYRLRKLRQKQGLTVAALAEKAGVSPGLLSQIENGQTTPLLDTLEKIARVLNTSVSYFLMKQEDVEDLLATLNSDILETLGDPNVQAVLRAVRDFDASEIKYILNFIQFFKQNRHLL